MSITTLKKKQSAMYNISGGKGFSLNNSRRVESHSHQQRSQTSMRGLGYRGHGGNFDNVVPIKSNYVNYDPFNKGAISVKNTRGMITTKFKWINRPFPFSTVQNLDLPSYATYCSNKIGNKTKADFCNGTVSTDSGICGNNTNMPSLHKKSNTSCYQVSNFVKKPPTDYKNYYKTEFLNKHNIPPPPKLQSYPPRIPNSRHCCTGFVKTPSYGDFIQRLKC